MPVRHRRRQLFGGWVFRRPDNPHDGGASVRFGRGMGPPGAGS
jgi:hypothetical protein